MAMYETSRSPYSCQQEPGCTVVRMTLCYTRTRFDRKAFRSKRFANTQTLYEAISPRRYTVCRPFSAFCYGAPSRGVASHALLRHNNAAGKSHIQYDPPLSRLPAKQKSNATLFAGLNHANENAIGAGSVGLLRGWPAKKNTARHRCLALLCG